MVREVALHVEKADADTLDKRAVERVPVPDDLGEGFTVWLLDTLRVKHAVEEVFLDAWGAWMPLSQVDRQRMKSSMWPEVLHVLISDEPGGNVLSVSVSRALQIEIQLSSCFILYFQAYPKNSG